MSLTQRRHGIAGARLAPCLLALALAGCPRQPPPIPGQDADRSDAGPVVDTDSDGDGVCDRTELARGMDIFSSDTDGDGISDRAELDFGFSPTRSDSPDRALLVYMSEVGASLEIPIARIVRGDGQSFSGAFQSLPVADPEGLDAYTFYAGSIAFGAVPQENVFEIVPEEQRFDGVSGRTELIYLVRFESTRDGPRDCVRAYPWRYVIKRSDDTVVFARRYVLVVIPEGDPAAPWCPSAGPCI